MPPLNGSNSSQFEECLAFMIQSGIEGSPERLAQLVREFSNNLFTTKLLVSYLKNVHNGRLNGLSTIPILYHYNKQQNLPAQRILSAFEEKFTSKAELTLLHLLRLSAQPVYQQHMVLTFKRSFMQRLCLRRFRYLLKSTQTKQPK